MTSGGGGCQGKNFGRVEGLLRIPVEYLVFPSLTYNNQTHFRHIQKHIHTLTHKKNYTQKKYTKHSHIFQYLAKHNLFSNIFFQNKALINIDLITKL